MTKPATQPLDMQFLLVLVALASLPYWVVTIPPGTDLPQHLSQIVLAKQVWNGERTDLIFTPWYFPQTLIYILVGLAMTVAPPLVAGKLVMTTMIALWLGASYYLAKCLGRPFATWLISSTLVFNFLFHWGLLNFLIAWPILCFFLARSILLLSRPEFTARDVLVQALLFLLLYYAHALVFLFANLALFALLIQSRRQDLRSLLFAALPAWVLALAWYPALAELRTGSGANVAPIWFRSPIERINVDTITDALLGCLANPVEHVTVFALFAWITLTLYQHRKPLSTAVHIPLLTVGGLMVGGWLILPEHYLNTIFFGARWLPLGMTLILLSLPAPNLPGRLTVLVPLTLYLGLAAVTVTALKLREHEEQDGLLEALMRVQPSDNLLAIDRLGSNYVKGVPDLQIFSYSQAIHGNNIHFSFAEHYSSIVMPRQRVDRIVTQRDIWAELTPQGGTPREFSALLVGADPDTHQTIVDLLGLGPAEPATTSWRLYRLNSNRNNQTSSRTVH